MSHQPAPSPGHARNRPPSIPALALVVLLATAMVAFLAVGSDPEPQAAAALTSQGVAPAPSPVTPLEALGSGTNREEVQRTPESVRPAAPGEVRWTGRLTSRDGRPIAGEVCLLDAAGTAVLGEARSLPTGPEAGRFQLRLSAHVAAGKPDLRDPVLVAHASEAGVAVLELPGPQTGTADVGTLVLEGGASLTGTARDPHGNPRTGLVLLAAARGLESDPSLEVALASLGTTATDSLREALTLRAEGAMRSARAVVQPDGSFHFGGLVPGRYQIEVAGRNWGSGNRGVHSTGSHVEIGDQDSIAFTLQAVDRQGRPVPHAQALLYGDAPFGDYFVRASLDLEGAQGGVSVWPGRAHLLITAPGAPPYLDTLEIVPGPRRTYVATLALPRAGILEVEAPPGVEIVAAPALPPAYDRKGFLDQVSVIERARVDATRSGAVQADAPQTGQARFVLHPGRWRIASQDQVDFGMTPGDWLEVQVGADEERRLILPD